jgi:hypothetical protein
MDILHPLVCTILATRQAARERVTSLTDHVDQETQMIKVSVFAFLPGIISLCTAKAVEFCHHMNLTSVILLP